jgi:hypothetical protein
VEKDNAMALTPEPGRELNRAPTPVEPIDRITSGLLQILADTQTLSEETKVRVRVPVESHVKNAAPYLFWRLSLHAFEDRHLLKLLAAVSVLPILFVSVLPEIRDARAGAAAPLAGILLVASAVVGLLIGTKLADLLRNAFRDMGGRVSAFAATAAILLLIPSGLDVLRDWGWAVATVQRGLWASGLFFLWFLVVAQALHVAKVVAVRLTIRRVPAAETVTSLLLALQAVERATEPEGDQPLNSVALANQVHELATTIERALPLRFPGLHPELERRLRGEARSIAAAVENRAVEILLGANAARTDVASRLGDMLVRVAEDDWRSLPRDGMEPSAPLVPGLQTMMIAAVPLVIALVIWSRVLPLNASPELTTSLIRFGIVWAAIHVLLAIDPRATTKAEATSKLLTFLNE